MAVRWLSQQGRLGVERFRPESIAHNVPDRDGAANVVILVRAPPVRGVVRRQDLHWGLGWEVGRGAWRHVSVEYLHDPRYPRFVYWGGITKPASSLTDYAQHFPVAALDLQGRLRIEEIAREVEVAELDGRTDWNSQSWTQELLRRMCQAGVITSGQYANAIAHAKNGTRVHYERA